MRLKIFIKSNKLFLLVFGVQDEKKLNAPESVKFFNSFVINDANLTQQTTWQLFSDKQNAFSISVPSNPIYQFDKGTSKTYYDVYTYTASDFSDGSYYMMLIKNSLPGYFVNGDSLIFENYKKSFNESTDTGMLQTSEITVNGSHGYKMNTVKKIKGNEFAFQIYMIFRGNRIYMPMTVAENGKENSEAINNFFKSFTLLPFQETQWKPHTSPGNNFSAWVPSGFELKKTDSSSYKNLHSKIFITTDKKSVVDYSVEVEPYSKYYWSNSDSSFFKKMTNAFLSAEDSLIYYRQLKGDTAGADVLIKIHNSALYKRLRVLVNGDTLYTLFSYFPPELTESQNINLFFDEFKFINPQPNTIFKNKQNKLQAALLSTDSASRSEALETLNAIDFSKGDFDFLHTAWLKSYPADSTQYRKINYYIGKKIEELHDSLTIDFIYNNYARFNTTQPELQMNMLEILESFKTQRSYDVLKKLLLVHPPSAGFVYNFSNRLADSLSLSKNLFPEISKLYSDSLIGSALVKLTVDLADSNKISIDDLKKNNVELIYTLSKSQLKALENNPDEYPVYNNYVINILKKLNTRQSIELLKSFMQSGIIDIKYNAAMALAEINQPVPTTELNFIAADNGYRIELYSSLKNINKITLFPTKSLTQQKFAESYLYNYVIEDEDSIRIEAKGTRTAKVNGVLRRYFLFKVNSVYEDETTSHLAICGPFDMNAKNVDVDENELQINVFYDEEYDSSSTEKLFRQFIKPPS